MALNKCETKATTVCRRELNKRQLKSMLQFYSLHSPWHNTRQPVTAAVLGQHGIVGRAAVVEYQMITLSRAVRPGANRARSFVKAGNGSAKKSNINTQRKINYKPVSLSKMWEWAAKNAISAKYNNVNIFISISLKNNCEPLAVRPRHVAPNTCQS